MPILKKTKLEKRLADIKKAKALLKSGLTYREIKPQIDRSMGWLSNVLGKKLSPSQDLNAK